MYIYILMVHRFIAFFHATPCLVNKWNCKALNDTVRHLEMDTNWHQIESYHQCRIALGLRDDSAASVPGAHLAHLRLEASSRRGNYASFHSIKSNSWQ